TNVSAPVLVLKLRRGPVVVVSVVADNGSWGDAGGGCGTATMRAWNRLKSRNPSARLVCIDIQPNRTTQACEREDVLNVGGFSDQVLEVIAEFVRGRLTSDHWVGAIEKIEL